MSLIAKIARILKKRAYSVNIPKCKKILYLCDDNILHSLIHELPTCSDQKVDAIVKEIYNMGKHPEIFFDPIKVMNHFAETAPKIEEFLADLPKEEEVDHFAHATKDVVPDCFKPLSYYIKNHPVAKKIKKARAQKVRPKKIVTLPIYVLPHYHQYFCKTGEFDCLMPRPVSIRHGRSVRRRLLKQAKPACNQADFASEEIIQCNVKLQIGSSPGDGNCWYHSIRQVGALSLPIADFKDLLKKHCTNPFLLEQLNAPEGSFESYADNDCIALCAAVLKCRFCIHTDGAQLQILYGEEGEVYHIHHCHNHYEPMFVIVPEASDNPFDVDDSTDFVDSTAPFTEEDCASLEWDNEFVAVEVEQVIDEAVKNISSNPEKITARYVNDEVILNLESCFHTVKCGSKARKLLNYLKELVSLKKVNPKVALEKMAKTLVKVKSKMPKNVVEAHVMYTDLKSKIDDMFDSCKEKLLSLTDYMPIDALNHYADITLDTFEKMLETIKPMCLVNLISQLAASQSHTEDLYIVAALCELYEVFWTPALLNLKKVLVYVIAQFFAAILRSTWGSQIKNQTFVRQGSSKLADFMQGFGFDLEKVPDWCAPVVGVILSVVAIITGGTFCEFSGASIEKVLKNVRKFGSNLKGVKDVIESGPKVFSFVMSQVASLFGYEYISDEDAQVRKFREDLLKFKVKVYALSDDIIQDVRSVLDAPERVKECLDIMKDLDAVYETMLKQKSNTSAAKPIFDEIKCKVKVIHEWSRTYLDTAVKKIEPALIQLSGKPGVGKSYLMEAIVRRLEKKHNRPKMMVYARNSSDQYWSGYNGQEVVYYDEWGQTKKDEDHADLMLVKNPDRSLLNMADLEEKGRQFSSWYIIAASNLLDSFGSATVKTAEALDRRRDLLVIVDDPNYDAFVAEHGVAPGDWRDPNDPNSIGNPYKINAEGQKEYYYTDDCSHLRFYLIPSRASHRKGDYARRVTLDELVDILYAYHLKFKKFFTESLLERNFKTDAEVVEKALDVVPYKRCYRCLLGVLDPEYFEGKLYHPECLTKDNDEVSTDSAIDEVASLMDWFNTQAASTTSKKDAFVKPRMTKADLPPEKPKPKGKYYKHGVDYNDNLRDALDEVGMPDDYVISLDAAKEYVNSQRRKPKNQSAAQSAQAFTTFNVKRNPIIALSGPPGTGKTTAIDAALALMDSELVDRIHARDLPRHTYRRPILVVEDISINRECFQQARSLIGQVYDGLHSVQLLIVTFNSQMLEPYFDTQEERSMFYRRLQEYKFQYEEKKRNLWSTLGYKKYYTAEDVALGAAPHSKMVGILDCYATACERVLVQAGEREGPAKDVYVLTEQLAEKIASIEIDAEAHAVSLCRAVPYINLKNVKPNFHVKFSNTLEEAFPILYNNPECVLSWLITKKVQMLKGTYGDAIQIGAQFSSSQGAKPLYPGNLNKFIVMINNARFESKHDFTALLEGRDCSIVIGPRPTSPKIIRIFKVDPDVTIGSDLISDKDGAHKMNAPTKTVYAEHIEVLTAQKEEIAKQIDSLETVASENLGFRTFNKYPTLNNAIHLCSFLLKVSVAFGGIKMFLKNGKNKYLSQLLSQEGRAGQIKKRRPRPYMNESWDEDWDKYMNPTARKTSRRKLREKACLLYGVEKFNDLSDLQIKDFLHRYNEEDDYEDEAEFSSGNDAKDAPRKPNITASAELRFPEAKKVEPLHEHEADVDKPDRIQKTKRKKVDAKTFTDVMTEPMKEWHCKVLAESGGEVQDEVLCDPSVKSMLNLAATNSVEIHNFGSRVCYGFMVSHRIGCTVNHAAEDGSALHAVFRREGVEHNYPIKILKRLSKIDLLIFEIEDTKCPLFRSILHLMPNFDADLNNIADGKFGTLVTFYRNTKFDTIMHSRPVRIGNRQVITTETGPKEALEYVGYTAGVVCNSLIGTAVGDCGSVLILMNPHSPIKFLSIHNAADKFTGYGSFLMQEYFKPYVLKATRNESSKYVVRSLKHGELNLREYTREEIMGMPIVGNTETPVNWPRKTCYWRSPLRMEKEDSYQPSILYARDNRLPPESEDPLFKSLGKWNHPQPENVDIPLLDYVTDCVAKWYANTVRAARLPVKILTTTEAINASRDKGISPLVMRSSSGYPWRKYHVKKEGFFEIHQSGKDIFYSIKHDDEGGKKLQESINEIIDICRIPGQKPAIIFNGSLKDEPVKIKKIEENNTRSFAGAPLDYTIAHRKYFASAIGAITFCRDKLPSQVGINPQNSLDWHQMICNMLETSDLGFDADFKSWDSTVVEKFMRRVPRVYNAVYRMNDPNWKPEDDLIRTNLHAALWKPMLTCPHPDDPRTTLVLQAPGGMVSGQPGTAPDNCLIHVFYLFYAWMKIMLKVEKRMATFQCFLSFVNAKVYGDDGIYAVSPAVIKVFNFESFQEVMKELNVTCTPASKGDEILKWRPVLELEFLKRNTVRIGAYYFGALQPKSFHKMLSWSKSKAHHFWMEPDAVGFNEEDVFATMNAALSEAVFNGRKFWNELAAHFDKVATSWGWSWFSPAFVDCVASLDLPIRASDL